MAVLNLNGPLSQAEARALPKGEKSVSGGTFSIVEITEDGTNGAEFYWDVNNRSIPKQPWGGGVQQRTSRMDYPGTENVTEQVLGSNFTNFDLKGDWQDKFNSAGYAIKTWKDFQAMVRRGNITRIEFKSMAFTGIITDFAWTYRREYDIGYSITFSPHRRVDDAPSRKNLVAHDKSPSELSDKIKLAIQNDMKSINDRAPSAQLAGSLGSDLLKDLENLTDSSNAFDIVNTQRILAIGADKGLSLRKAIAITDLVVARAARLSERVKAVRADTSLLYQTPLSVLHMESWARGLNASALRIAVDGYDAKKQLRRRADPRAKALYRPFAGESLYSISNRFYNTPQRWREIKTRNNLTYTQMTGLELLIIPEE